MEVNTLNANLKKSKKKVIKFYGSFEELSDVAALQEVSFVQEQQMVTKSELVRLQAGIRSEAQASQAEFRNETQATIQSTSGVWPKLVSCKSLSESREAQAGPEPGLVMGWFLGL